MLRISQRRLRDQTGRGVHVSVALPGFIPERMICCANQEFHAKNLRRFWNAFKLNFKFGIVLSSF